MSPETPRLIPGAVYRFARTTEVRYYRAGRTPSGVDFLYPIQVEGSRRVDRTPQGRPYVILYLLTPWGKLAASGYWLEPRQLFEQIYVTDATVDDLELVTTDIRTLPQVHEWLDDILNRDQVILDMEVWGQLLDTAPDTPED